MDNTIFPWQKMRWQQLWQCHQQQRLPHGLLFTGMDGVGKKQFARIFAHALLCSNTDAMGKRCEKCHACSLIAAKSHSDLMVVEPEEKKHAITVDQIREVVQFVNETPLHGGYRVVIIQPATAMNINAANALLKTLEEPTANTLLILICDASLRLPATIKSRCQKIVFAKPAKDEALAWLEQNEKDMALPLKLAHGSPLQALAWLEQDKIAVRQQIYRDLTSKIEPLKLAAQWQEFDLLLVIDLLISWTTDLLRSKLAGDSYYLLNEDYKIQIMQISATIAQANIISFADYLQKNRAFMLTGMNINKQLLLEDMLIHARQYVSC